MNAKHSAILLTGLLLLMMGLAWAQTTTPPMPTCPVVIYRANINYRPSENAYKWVRADWNAKADHWEIDCNSEFPSANANATSNAYPPPRPRDYNTMTKATNYNVAANAVNANVRRPRSIRREPNTRRP
jgi:hypothetical protein